MFIQVLSLFFLPNFPGYMCIPCKTSIPDSKVDKTLQCSAVQSLHGFGFLDGSSTRRQHLSFRRYLMKWYEFKFKCNFRKLSTPLNWYIHILIMLYAHKLPTHSTLTWYLRAFVVHNRAVRRAKKMRDTMAAIGICFPKMFWEKSQFLVPMSKRSEKKALLYVNFKSRNRRPFKVHIFGEGQKNLVLNKQMTVHFTGWTFLTEGL